MLATSGQFAIKSESDQKPCLLPYWKRNDLERLAALIKRIRMRLTLIVGTLYLVEIFGNF
jgi:hypothetical protein